MPRAPQCANDEWLVGLRAIGEFMGRSERTIRRWIAAGVPSDPDDTPTVTDVEIFPPAAVLEGEGAS